ncbi:hypothetical protein ACK3ZY_02315 [Aeromonas caviae]|uniref:hypothetical protein n=1 Tax=Aeromonas caviae TaxID=648 RepID=UPI002B4A4E27|nr:hypothetical protein [Aeromonas caviae]
MRSECNISGKNVLFIGIGFYDYDQAIVNALKEHGAQVTYLTEGFNSRLLRIKSKIIKGYTTSFHHQTLIDKLKRDFYDIIFVIKAAYLSSDNMRHLRYTQKNARFILYQWDSISRVPNAKLLLNYFDEIYSFDREDCVNYGFKFRPLFFRNEITHCQYSEKKYDLSFVGWCHDGRGDVVLSIMKFNPWLKFKPYLYASHRERLSFLFGAYSQYISTQKINFDSYISLSSGSVSVLDVPHRMQSGLTIRAIETLGLEVKLVTTNKDIVNYDFFHPQNILVIDRDNPCLDEAFFKTEYLPVSTDIMKRYSISGWIVDIFG